MICPLNADIYFEVMKQDDEQTLMATAGLIDDLSLGVCLLPMPQRFELEAFHFVESTRQESAALHQLWELVWTKTAYVLGFITPDSDAMPKDLNMAIQKSFADYMWSLGLIDVLTVMGPANVAARQSPFEDISDALNSGKFANLEVHASFKEMFLSEVQGILDVYRDAFCDLFRYIYERDTGNKLSDAERQDTRSGQMFINLIYNALRLNKITNQFPSLRIGAGLHAAVRWDRSRKYKPNDLFDFRHAIAALPYCDLFFTERSLCHLLRDRNLKFEYQFTCQAVYKPSEALKLVDQGNP
ncbi:hypothetical protein [Blastopirellula marina]|uniref:Uncharacterized protein n=1 Tax=Blastopirellula marina DSM 3645 TaxID=314230 RepID=A3ZS33_9BACT|nr:hypothetical protein [Blastopirellula marina]EAQ80497.1 hypothetical protein DSM3645_14165 [Blastopirellula marina DSM 3645]